MGHSQNIVEINEEVLQDLINIETGVLYPLKGFMIEADFLSVVENHTLQNGQVFTMPITLDVQADSIVKKGDVLGLAYKGCYIAEMDVEDVYMVRQSDWETVFGTCDIKHPGLCKEINKSPKRVGGTTRVIKRDILGDSLKPSETKRLFDSRKWKTIVGFQTRNPIHKAHEYLQRLGLEMCDGLFINPLVGWKKSGDFTQEAIMEAYEVMIERFYPSDRVYLAGLKTQMRYAGPREAIFHALIRRNLGCTHFIIGRDHAGVGNFYGEYDAHKLASELISKYDLGIKLVLTREPYYCEACKEIVTDKTCSHYYSNRVPISGTKIREYISNRKMPDEVMMRKEVLAAILDCNEIFINNEETNV